MGAEQVGEDENVKLDSCINKVPYRLPQVKIKNTEINIVTG